MTAPRIPRIPPSQRQHRFGTDPDDRPPMTPGDAYAAIALVLACIAAAMFLAAGYAHLKVTREIARQEIAKVEAQAQKKTPLKAIERDAK